MRNLLVILSAFTLILGANSCSKSDSNGTGGTGGTGGSPSDKTVTNLSGTYLLTALNINTDGVDDDGYAKLDACEKDNQYSLKSTLQYAVLDIGKVCDPEEGSTGTWKLSSDSDSLVIDGKGNFIKSWNGKTLVLQNKETDGLHLTIETQTLVKQ